MQGCLAKHRNHHPIKLCKINTQCIDLQSLPTFKQSFINHKTSQCSTRLSRGELAALKFQKKNLMFLEKCKLLKPTWYIRWTHTEIHAVLYQIIQCKWELEQPSSICQTFLKDCKIVFFRSIGLISYESTEVIKIAFLMQWRLGCAGLLNTNLIQLLLGIIE